MSTFETAVIGVGSPPDQDAPGYSIGYAHGNAYRDHPDCELVACADVVRDHAESFAAEFEIDTSRAYEDYRELLSSVEPDVVSVCTPPNSHAPIVVDCARQGVVDAIHCEKPMAVDWSECGLMVRECDRGGVQLTFNHMRRFHPRWRAPKRLIDDGVLGEVERIETTAPDLLDWGTHCFDLCGMYAGDRPGEWVFGQVADAIPDAYGGAYDHHTESQALAMWEYEDGVVGIASTGEGTAALGPNRVHHRIRGTEGVAEVGWHDAAVRYRQRGDSEWTDIEFDRRDDANAVAHEGAIDDALTGLQTGADPELRANNALNATELIFGIWESARRRSPVELPLTIEGNPLEAMIDSGDLPVRDGTETTDGT